MRIKIPCEDCIASHKGFNKPVPDCIENCGWTKIIPENFEIMMVIERYLGSFFTMGSINLTNIQKALEFEGLEVNQTNIQKILIYLNNASSIQQEDKTNGKKIGS